ncbi:hypothetical protein NW752_001193 [Fusarium irregulare]|uniref:chitin synthase n=1 Tax=Fusarium irregulare TaxID=2494466 RepID=A0A9W8PGH6_9HYPO|nr:hypothetical protein NW766_010771 [Fusarium irregulare]KAJ4026254.1 hypothetical protein NW752_001193 [Fusarium irregulare]
MQMMSQQQGSPPRSQAPSPGLSDSSSENLASGNVGYFKLFACPYAKRDPEGRRHCSKKAWKSIHRLRQHIYRCHTLPIKCPSCAIDFDSSPTFRDHIQAADDGDHCEAEEPIRGLENLLEKLKPKKDTSDEVSDEEMWRVLYSTLFPNDPKNTIPSPYVEGDQLAHVAVSSHGRSTPSLRSVPLCHTPNSRPGLNSRCVSYQNSEITPAPRRPASIASRGSLFAVANEATSPCPSPQFPTPIYSRPQTARTNNHGFNPQYVREEYYQTRTPDSSEARSLQDERSPSPRGGKLRKERNVKTMEAQVTAFKAWEKPHRTDEHSNPGEYQGVWKYLARCLTFYIPSWLLEKFFKMDDARRRMAFRQKVFFCLLLAAIYTVICYFLIFQPIVSCVIKIDIGMFGTDSQFCEATRWLIYVYMGLGGAFMLLVAICVMRVRYRSRKFEEHDALLVMHMPCYNEDEATLRKTIDSCVDSSYENSRKLLFIVADGKIAVDGRKPSHRILVEDIFQHEEDPEMGIDNEAKSYTSFDLEGVSENKAHCYTGFFRGVRYVLVTKVGRDEEQAHAKPGNRGKRDSQLLVYNFFHYVNYRRLWSPLFEKIEFQMRACLDIDATEAMHMLVVDCDTVLEKTGISYLVHQLQKNHNLIGVCGYTGVNNPFASFVAMTQVFEYWLTHAVLKAVETVFSNVLVLSGCFTIYRLKWPNNRPAVLHPLLLEDYAGSYDKTLHEHNLLSIGEDRYLSTLAIRYFGADCRLQYFSAATCTTTAPDTLSVLLDQRRRWTNSLIHCHFSHLNVLPFEASFWTQLRLLFVIGAELFMVFVLPLALPAGLVLAIVSVLLTDYAWAILLAFCLLPVLICVICNDWKYIPYYVPFFPMVAIFSIVIPLFSMWKQDNVKWGKTRG